VTWVRRVGARGAVLLVVCGFVGGLLGLAGAAACVGLVAWGRVTPRRLLLASLALAVALPVVWVVGNLGRLGSYSVAVVSHNPAAQWCGLLLVVTLLCGVFLERPEEDERR
jgi:hypothetical protein